MKNRKLIIFDLDGTLIDSAPDLANAINYMLKTLGKAEFEEDVIRNWVGNGASTLVKRALVGKREIDESIDLELFEKALNIFLEYYSKNICLKTQLYDGVKETLQTLKNRSYILAIVTNKPYDFIEPIIKALEVEDLFELYIGGDSLQKRKPDPLPLKYVCEKLNIEIEESVMVGDSKNDILAAKAAEMDSIGVSYGYNYGEDIDMYNPNFVVDTFSEISKILVN